MKNLPRRFQGESQNRWLQPPANRIYLLTLAAAYLPLLALLLYAVIRLTPPLEGIFLVVVVCLTTGFSFLAIMAIHQVIQSVWAAINTLNHYLSRLLKITDTASDEPIPIGKQVSLAIQSFEQYRMNLERSATEDFLTGLPNRRSASEHLYQSLTLASRNNLSLCIAILDLDHFKQVNDQYGHEVGDQVLVQISRHLKFSVRGGDWVARWGGEEFLLALFCDALGAKIALGRINRELANLTIPVKAASPIHVTASIGFTVVLSDDSAETCLERADQALYYAKQHGRNQVVCAETLEFTRGN